ncbi:hypothetical protein CALVIDRAFT_46100 [Calocera viscosa TUFC12733]|uniref:Uncharacterized protein n=1 Tax=Calocera viscosa (strain TUFC12733) TaxID=1330018 RepID=A0A167P510_CALVF|nr:hypothetical protein CALVIDRAFT_46100 [Calocera viscosa TUFC12733]
MRHSFPLFRPRRNTRPPQTALSNAPTLHLPILSALDLGCSRTRISGLLHLHRISMPPFHSTASAYSTSTSSSAMTTASTGSRHAAKRIMEVLTGIPITVGERRLQLDALADRCNRLAEELDVWSVMWDTEGTRIAGQAAQKTLEIVLKECETWQGRWFGTQLVSDDQIRRDVAACIQALAERMDDYNRSLLHEILLSGREAQVRLFKQEKTLAAFQNMSTTSDPNVKQQLRDLIDAGYQELRSSTLSRHDRDTIFEGLRSLLSIDNVPTSVQLQGELTTEPIAIIINPGSDIYQGRWHGNIVAVKRFRESNPNPNRAGVSAYDALPTVADS